MDKQTRNGIQRATQAARELIEQEYAEQLEGVFDIRLDGTIAKEPGEHLDAPQRVLRKKLVAAVEHMRSGGADSADAVAAYRREAAFTTLNRFVALKMLEARGLVQMCISGGDQSAGFKEFVGLAPGLAQLPDHGYRVYIESLCDEIGREVRVLFERTDPSSLLWPQRQALVALLDILNAADLAPVWGEDETVGWVYQYFNSDNERRQMRAESQAPRNSRELAVRNQFFTPRYVVQFLTDNSLGRIWYEMRRGDTRLSDLEYLVRQPNEVFLVKGEQLPVDSAPGDLFSTGNAMFERTIHVPFRAKKDPRDIRVLDPACGSGHFLLYAFDLLLTVYEEAWADEASPASEATGRRLREDYSEAEMLRAALPGLILRHNLHGIDIDSRCTQIAALALWMRAQRAFKDLGISRQARPLVRKTNVVVAEPMAVDPDLRREFLAELAPRLRQLVELIFERTELAGEAGSLLRIEEDIRSAAVEIHAARGAIDRQEEGRWDLALEQLRQALRTYAERESNGRAFRRRLFVEDAARGLGFVELCRQRYEVVLMNPPFGSFAEGVRSWASSARPRSKNDIYAAFVERGVELLAPRSRLGAITSRTGFFLSSFQKWREELLLVDTRPMVVADLGHGVMDDAMVEAAAYCLELAA